MKILKIILYPFSLLYGLILAFRNVLYDLKILKSCSFDIPVICVGNLSYGGTGKTPLVEYLIRLLKDNNDISTLSRGYKRNTKGFVLANNNSLCSEIGDEPKQYKTKFPKIQVAVCENRCSGVNKLLVINPNTDIIILDDAFQHRAIKAGLNIILTDYNNLYTSDSVLPSGTLREFKYGAKRAEIIIVTKCPKILSFTDRKNIKTEINPKKGQYVFFSFIEYDDIQHFISGKKHENDSLKKLVLLFSGIANTKPLEQHLTEGKYSIKSLLFDDHHKYSLNNLIKIRETFNNIAEQNKIIVTTEKDLMRIETTEQMELIKYLPIFIIPIKVDFFPEDKQMFNEIIWNYVRNARKN